MKSGCTTERAELIPRSFARAILDSTWGAVREEDGDLLSILQVVENIHTDTPILRDKSYVILLVRMLAGYSVYSPPDSKLMAPPITNGLTRYDSVMGSSHDHTVYMVYRNNKAYPQCVIKYKY